MLLRNKHEEIPIFFINIILTIILQVLLFIINQLNLLLNFFNYKVFFSP